MKERQKDENETWNRTNKLVSINETVRNDAIIKLVFDYHNSAVSIILV
jgi:hypothetical protein